MDRDTTITESVAAAIDMACGHLQHSLSVTAGDIDPQTLTELTRILTRYAHAIAPPDPDLEEAAADAAGEAGWTGPHKDQYGVTYFKDETDGQTWTAPTWAKLCDDLDRPPVPAPDTATPRPWKYSTNVGPTKALIVEADGSTILELSNSQRSSSFERNVAFAVRAVNAHDDLVTALRKLVSLVDYANLDGRGFTGDNRTEWETEIEPLARAALDKATA